MVKQEDPRDLHGGLPINSVGNTIVSVFISEFTLVVVYVQTSPYRERGGRERRGTDLRVMTTIHATGGISSSTTVPMGLRT